MSCFIAKCEHIFIWPGEIVQNISGQSSISIPLKRISKPLIGIEREQWSDMR